MKRMGKQTKALAAPVTTALFDETRIWKKDYLCKRYDVDDYYYYFLSRAVAFH